MVLIISGTCAWLIGTLVKSVEAENSLRKKWCRKIDFRLDKGVRDCAAGRGTEGQSTPTCRRPACFRDEHWKR